MAKKPDGLDGTRGGGDRRHFGNGRKLAVGLAEAGATWCPPAGASKWSMRSARGRAAGGKTLRKACDIASRDSVDAFREAVLAEFGQVDVLLNAAGQIFRKPTVDITEAEWDKLMDVNLTGMLRACQSFYGPLKANGRGRDHQHRVAQFVRIAGAGDGVCGVEGGGAGAHAQPGGGVGASDGINVNAIAPGVFRTDLNAAFLDGTERGRELRLRTPMGRFGNWPRRSVGAAVLLASDACQLYHRPVHRGGRRLPGVGRKFDLGSHPAHERTGSLGYFG